MFVLPSKPNFQNPIASLHLFCSKLTFLKYMLCQFPSSHLLLTFHAGDCNISAFFYQMMSFSISLDNHVAFLANNPGLRAFNSIVELSGFCCSYFQFLFASDRALYFKKRTYIFEMLFQLSIRNGFPFSDTVRLTAVDINLI